MCTNLRYRKGATLAVVKDTKSPRHDTNGIEAQITAQYVLDRQVCSTAVYSSCVVRSRSVPRREVRAKITLWEDEHRVHLHFFDDVCHRVLQSYFLSSFMKAAVDKRTPPHNVHMFAAGVVESSTITILLSR